MNMFNLGQDIVPQWAVYLHMLPSFPFQRHISYFTKESNAFFSSGRQEPVKGWTWSSIVACKLLIIMFDPGCMYPLFPESEGSFFMVPPGLPWLEDEAGIALGSDF